MRKTVSFLLILFCPLFYAVGQPPTSYQKQKTKLGRKMGRQMTESDYYRTVSTNKIGYWGEETGNHGFTSFVGAMDGAVIGSLAKYYSYQNYYHGPRGINVRHEKGDSEDISALELTNLTFADEDGDGKLGKNETAQVYFDIINTGQLAIYGITPVLMAHKTKHVRISSPLRIDKLEGESALRYVIEVSGDGKRNPGKLVMLLRIRFGHGQYWDVQQIEL